MATDHANAVVPNWAELAFNFFVTYGKQAKEFLQENVRDASAGIVPEPPDARAWGFIVKRARVAGLIRPKGTTTSNRPVAHKAIKNVWIWNE